MRLRLIIAFIVIVLVTISVVVVFAGRGTSTEIQAFMYRGGMAGISQIVSSLETYHKVHGSWVDIDKHVNLSDPLPPNMMGANSGNQGFQGNMMRRQIVLSDASGKIIFHPSRERVDTFMTVSEKKKSIILRNGFFRIGYLKIEGDMVFLPDDERLLVGRLNRGVLTSAVIAGAIAFFIAVVLAYQLIKPLRELKIAADKLGFGDLSQRVDAGGNDEISDLGRAFNKMADSLEGSESKRKAMTADIAHELRNPIAIQRANIEAILDGVNEPNEENLNTILGQNIVLTRLVEDLRTLALVDSEALKIDLEEADLLVIIQDLVKRFKLLTDEKNIKVELKSNENLQLISIDKVRFGQVISNLISNAIMHTPVNGKIFIDLENIGNFVEIMIRDTGSGIPEESLPHIFDRFYRVDSSRSRASGGTGLGLAIARRITEVLGGTINASNHPDGGAVFTVSFPVN